MGTNGQYTQSRDEIALSDIVCERVERFTHEGFIEMCSILLYIGDVQKYIAVNDDGVVDFERSCTPFIEEFIQCLEITHELCVRNPQVGASKKDVWLTDGKYRKVLESYSSKFRERMACAVYPHKDGGVVLPVEFRTKSSDELEEMFIRTSSSILDLAERGVIGQCQRSRWSGRMSGLKLFLGRRTTQVRVSHLKYLSGKRSHSYSEEILLMCVAGDGSMLERVIPGCDSYWSLHAVGRGDTLYHGLITQVDD